MKEDPNIVPYKADPVSNPRKAYIRERTLSTGASIRIERFAEPGASGEYGLSFVYLSPVKDGQRTELKFALTDEAAAATHNILAEFFGVEVCA